MRVTAFSLIAMLAASVAAAPLNTVEESDKANHKAKPKQSCWVTSNDCNNANEAARVCQAKCSYNGQPYASKATCVQ
ncbi:hypothetical protein PTNB85_08472 [Pyrenophora teres f. teres]|nr:hypothetical protein HRS9139_10536 [Pyrenophora teres f. teres]KAE8829284.1 hypothetical protein PTNB85_08472 [Pyrenophora teres f. teres]KAE8841218.1 hypothetical protein HRS9122_05344 [Pyrenophora teres f. teres]